MRAINTIRRAGGIARAVERGIVTSGIMHALVEHRVPFVLAGSIRDDGPLPEGLSDTLAAQDAMRSEEHTSELQSQSNLVCRLLLEKKKKKKVDVVDSM